MMANTRKVTINVLRITESIISGDDSTALFTNSVRNDSVDIEILPEFQLNEGKE